MGTGFPALPVLAGSADYVASETFDRMLTLRESLTATKDSTLYWLAQRCLMLL